MFAVIETGGKQFKIKSGDIIKVEKLETDIGETVKFDNVLFLSDGKEVLCGTPNLENVNVEAEVLEHGRDKKVLVFKKRRRKDYKKRYGHRQYFTKLRITDIKVSETV